MKLEDSQTQIINHRNEINILFKKIILFIYFY